MSSEVYIHTRTPSRTVHFFVRHQVRAHHAQQHVTGHVFGIDAVRLALVVRTGVMDHFVHDVVVASQRIRGGRAADGIDHLAEHAVYVGYGVHGEAVDVFVVVRAVRAQGFREGADLTIGGSHGEEGGGDRNRVRGGEVPIR